MSYEIQAQARVAQGTGASRRLRNTGKLPGIVYGGSKTPVAIELDHNSMWYTLKEEAFHTALIKLVVDGATEQVLVRSVQYHPFKQLILHVDFQRVDESTSVEMKVPLHFANAEIAPGVKLDGGSIGYILNEVLVRCSATKLPEFIEVDLGNMGAGNGSIHLSDLKLPEGVELMSLVRGEDLAVANYNAPKGSD
ncbi:MULTISPECIES: 50S ribosomal protein L25/general stress protein Ctc [Silvimonas]|uniref:50S ribosomal protein L25/general stress protein Ctc n=1 Tax=Silvimonas TaxID=300264 RepID=UPI0024B36D2E|nr:MULTISPECIES: 50S ribosomal protein L25/general stress protein Ctc [Silvimonas]MDR3427657.1 50S ribosomal protein L25/general stress protein Ctc [Silvimonas sp.]